MATKQFERLACLLEPQALREWNDDESNLGFVGISQASLAISMKRIADTLERRERREARAAK